MPNTLTGLIPTIYSAFDEVGRELVGVIPGCTLDASAARGAIGQTLTSPVTPQATAYDIVPAATAPTDGSQSIGGRSLSISKSRRVPILWNGEEVRGVNTGAGVNEIFRDQIVQAIRTLGNEIERDVLLEARSNASRAFGTAGTTPFGTANDLSDSSSVLQIIEENGGANLTRSLVLSPAAMNNVRGKQAVLFKVNEAGTADLLRKGILGDLHGSQVRQSGQIAQVTKGTGASYTTNTAGYAVGATAITLITGTGTILAGDVITFAGDANKYVVETALTGGVVTLAKPGLRQAIPTSATAVTVGNNFTPSILFAKSAMVLATRAPALPKTPDGKEQDAAIDRMMVMDPITGISFEFSVYLQYRQISYEVGLAWGQRNFKTEHTALLLG